MKNKALLLLLALAGWLTDCGTPDISSAEAVTAPAAPWPVVAPDAVGIDPLVIDSIHREIQAGDYGFVDRFLVLRYGQLAADYRYAWNYDSVMHQYDTTDYQYNYDHTAWHPYYRDTELHTLQSVTKSVTSLLLGIAVDEGLLPSIDTPALTYFSEYDVDRTDPRWQALTVADLLTMRSGIQWDEQNYDAADNSCILMENSDDWLRYVLSQPMDATPGRQFEYNSGASVLLGKIVREATGQRIDRWAEVRLFAPLGIQDYYWKLTPQGEVDTEGGLYLTAYDLAKIGQLLLQGGQWNGRSVVSRDWIDRSLHPTVQFPGQRGYGFQWWIPAHENGQPRLFAGNGYGGQFLMGVPEHDLLVVFNGWQHHGRPERSTWRALEERILPGVE